MLKNGVGKIVKYDSIRVQKYSNRWKLKFNVK